MNHVIMNSALAVCVKRSFTLFSVALSNSRVQYLRGYRKLY